MKLTRACLWAGLACLAAATPANAADWTRPAYRSTAVPARIPVPAPIPVQEHFKWYIRADLGLGLAQAPSLSENGIIFDEGGTNRLMNSGWFDDDLNLFFTGGVGAGAYLTPQLRGDITVDVRTETSADARGTFAAGGSTWSVREDNNVGNAVALANLYWDLVPRGSGVTPYIGAGIGFAVRSIDRSHFTTQDPALPAGDYSGQSTAHEFAPAAAVMAGLAWTLWPGTMIDLNYRLLWMGGVETTTQITTTGPDDPYASRLNIGDSFDHQVRAGLRWNVW